MVDCDPFWSYFGRRADIEPVSRVSADVNTGAKPETGSTLDFFSKTWYLLRKSGFNDYNMLRLKTNLSPTNCDGFMSIVGQERFENYHMFYQMPCFQCIHDIFEYFERFQ